MKRVALLLLGSTLLGCATRLAEPAPRRAPKTVLLEANAEPVRAKENPMGEEAKAPSWALLRKFMAGRAPALVDGRSGVVVVTVGPRPSFGDGESSADVDEGKRACGEEAGREATRELEGIWSSRDASFDLDELSPCTALSCTKPAQGEWDGEVHFTFARTGDDRIVLQSIVHVLDVPLRPSADEDRAKAMNKARAIERTGCPKRI